MLKLIKWTVRIIIWGVVIYLVAPDVIPNTINTLWPAFGLVAEGTKGLLKEWAFNSINPFK